MAVIIGRLAPVVHPPLVLGVLRMPKRRSPSMKVAAQASGAGAPTIREQTTTVEPDFRWIKNPAAISPV